MLLVLFLLCLSLSVFVKGKDDCKTFAHIGTISSRSHWTNDNVTLLYGDRGEYRLVKRLGSGTFGEGYLGHNVKYDYPCVIKIFTERMHHDKMINEIVILQTLCGGPNIIKVHDVLKESIKEIPAIVFEYVNTTNPSAVYQSFSDQDVKYYMKQLLKALEYVHSEGIIHRDIKPSNVLIDHANRKLRLIDFGLSVFHQKGQNHTIAGTRNFKAPELLMYKRTYDFSVDMWSVGTLFAGIIFKKDYLFDGMNNLDTVAKISRVLGTDALKLFVSRYNIPIPNNHTLFSLNKPKMEWKEFVTPENAHLATEPALDLLSKLLVLNPESRYRASQALNHPYFENVE